MPKPKRIRWQPAKETEISAGSRLILFLDGHETRGRLIVRAVFGKIEKRTAGAVLFTLDKGGSVWLPLFVLQLDPKRSSSESYFGRMRVNGEFYIEAKHFEALQEAATVLAA